MSVSFPSLSESIRLPFAYAEFDATGTSDDPSIMPYTVLLTGQMFSSGTAEPLSVQRPMNKEQAENLFGKGSMLASMCGAYFTANSVTKMLAIPILDAEEGEYAEGAINFSGSVTSAAPVCLYIGGILVRAAASYKTSAADVASSLAMAINKNSALPVTATYSDGQVTLHARHKGECGNDIDLRLSYYDEDVPAGLQITITPMQGGKGNPDISEIIASMGNDQYHVIACPWTDKLSLSLLQAELSDRWGPLRQIDGQAIVVVRGSFASCVTFSGNRNDKHLTVIPSENSPTNPWEDCAASTAVIAYYGNSDPARGFNTLLVPGVLAPSSKDIWPGYPEKNQGLFEGLSTRYVAPDGTVRFQKLITTHRLNDLGAETQNFLSLNSPLTLSYLRYDWNNYLRSKYPRHKLALDEDSHNYRSSDSIMTPKLGRSEAVARFGSVWLPMGLVQGFEQFKESLVCERNSKNHQRLDWLLQPNLMNQFEVAGTLFKHIV